MFDSKEKTGKTTTTQANRSAEALASNVIGLAQTIREAGAEQARMAGEYVRDRVDDIKTTGAEAVTKLEKTVKSKPRQSIATAFLAGMVVNAFLRRRD